MRHGAAVSFRFSFSVAEGVVWARRVAAKEVERQHHRGRGVTEFVTLESAVWRTDPALSRNLKPPPLGGGVFTRADRRPNPTPINMIRKCDKLIGDFGHVQVLQNNCASLGYGIAASCRLLARWPGGGRPDRSCERCRAVRTFSFTFADAAG